MSSNRVNLQLDQFDELQAQQATSTAADGRRSSSFPGRDSDEPTGRNSLNDRVVRKLDYILLPFLALLFLFNSLDRANVGNAETADFTKDIGIQPENLNTAIEIFFVFFVTLQPVGAALGRKYGMSHWVMPCMAVWGVCTTLHAFIRSKWQLYLLRAVIGTLEAGFYPTAVTYLSLFYTKYEFARRLGLFYGQYCIAGAFGGTLSYFVFTAFQHTETAPSRGWKSWQILFVLEGSATIILAAIGFFWLPRSARTAWFLQTDERWWAERRIELDYSASLSQSEHTHSELEPEDTELQDSVPDLEEASGLLRSSASRSPMKSKATQTSIGDRGLSVEDVVEAVLDWKLWYLLICNILSAVPVTAFSLFLPLVLKPLTSSPAHANLLTAPPYLIGGMILFAFSHWSDKSRQRIVPTLWSLALLILGLTGVVALSKADSALRYIFLCILLGGTFVASPLTIAWFTSNVPEPGKRSIILGINGWGNLAGVLSSIIFHPRFAPTYTIPFVITLAIVTLAFIGYFYFRHLIILENRRRKALLEQWTEGEVQAELSRGKGPREVSRGARLFAFVGKYADISSLGHLQDRLAETGRRGDERLTFKYGL